MDRIHGGRRVWGNVESDPWCAYCGIEAHESDRVDGELVPACEECLGVARELRSQNFAQRRERVRRYLRGRYHALLRTPHWTRAELESLDGVTRIDVENALRARAQLEFRLSYVALEAVAREAVASTALKCVA